MTFLSPALLLLGFAAAVPLVLHLLQRHQGPRLVFPALRYLQRAEREHKTRIRLRQILLLALRILALLLLAAAAARPFLRGRGASHEPTSAVLILDNSLSTSAVVGDRRVLDELRNAALRGLDAASPGDRFWLIRAGSPWEAAITGDAARVAAAVRATEPSGGAADLRSAIQRASSILATEPPERAREIQLLTDLQASALAGAAPADAGAPPIVALTPASEVSVNRAVTDVVVGGGLPPRANERSTVSAEITGPDDADSLTARLVLDAAVRAAARVSPGAVAVLSFPAMQSGVVTGRVEIDADALTGDDRRHFVTHVSPPPAVASSSPLPFLDEALAVLEEAGRIRRAPAGAAELVFASAAEGVDAVRSGAAAIVLPPTSPLELPATNRRLAEAGVPWRLGAPAPGEARIAVESLPDELATVLADTRLRQVYRLEPQGSPDDTVLIRLRGGAPWAIAGRAPGGGRYILLATPLTVEGGTIPTSTAMLPLLDRLITARASDAAADRDYRPGEVVTLPQADSILPPDGPAAAVQRGALYRLERTGIYRLFLGGRLVDAYAVNPAAEESELARLEPEDLAAALPGRDVVMADPETWAGTIYRQRLGYEASTPLIVLALLLLLIELALAGTGRGGRTAAAAGGPAAAHPDGGRTAGGRPEGATRTAPAE